MNKGCDFAVLSENFLKHKNGNDKPPKHRDVFNLILSAIGKNRKKSALFYSAARRVFQCESPDVVLLGNKILGGDPECKFERALKLLKWMWIEQDVTYWTGTGREMLWQAFEALKLR